MEETVKNKWWERERAREGRERDQSNGSVIIWTSVLLSLRSSRTDVDCFSSGIKSWKLFFFLSCRPWNLCEVLKMKLTEKRFILSVCYRSELEKCWSKSDLATQGNSAATLFGHRFDLFVCLFFPHLSSVSRRKSSVTNTGSQPLFLIRSNRPRWRQCFISTSTNKVPGSTPS